jgi:hydrogenase expression/formation protein HypC
MCLGIPGRLVELTEHPDIARVDVEGVVRDINIALLGDDPAEPGDWVLIHLGFALQTMTEAEVEDARSTLSILGEGRDPDDGDVYAGWFEEDASVAQLPEEATA